MHLLTAAALLLSLRATAVAAPANDDPKRVMIVVSDLHLGEGAKSPLEDFKIDETFSDFIDHLIAQAEFTGGSTGRRALQSLEQGFARTAAFLGSSEWLRPMARAAFRTSQHLGYLGADHRITLVFAGDTFDFIKVVTPPAGAAFPSSGPMATPERDTGPTEEVAVLKMRRILEAHPIFFSSMARLLAKGHQIVMLPGNHDQELSYSKVRRALRERVAVLAGPGAARIRYNPQFYYQDGIMVEHGHRYESVNSIEHIAWPFKGDGPTRQLRPAASTYLVAEIANPLRQRLPHITQLSRGMAQVMEVMTSAPNHLPGVVALMGRLAMRVGERQPPAEEAKIIRRHQRILRSQLRLNDLPRQVNAARAARGEEPLTEAQLLAKLFEFDGKDTPPFLRGTPAPSPTATGTLPPGPAAPDARWLVRRLASAAYQRIGDTATATVGGVRTSLRVAANAVKVVRPYYIAEWSSPEDNSSLREGQEVALRELGAQVVISGHTHTASLETTEDGQQIANSGTWTPILAEGGTRAEPTAHLSYIRVSRNIATLRRWDAQTRRSMILKDKWLGSRRLGR